MKYQLSLKFYKFHSKNKQFVKLSVDEIHVSFRSTLASGLTDEAEAWKDRFGKAVLVTFNARKVTWGWGSAP